MIGKIKQVPEEPVNHHSAELSVLLLKFSFVANPPPNCSTHSKARLD
jgi:hypothetical protein